MFTIIAFWPSSFQAIVVAIQVVSAILHVVLGLVNDCTLWFDAESTNRKHLLENAFGVDITNTRSDGYYNNRFAESFERYITNTFESTFFSMKISEAMIPVSTLKSIIASLLLVLLLVFQPTGVSLSDVAQTVFSAHLLEDTVSLWAFHSKVKAVFQGFYERLVSTGANKRDTLLLVANAQEYECIKAHFKVRLDSKIFDKMNGVLSQQWIDIERRVTFMERDE